ncbi:hypothetical protein R3I94_016734 [Phoxinus phoxinus]
MQICGASRTAGELQQDKREMAKKEDEIPTLDPGEKQILRRVRRDSINSGTPNFSPDTHTPEDLHSDDSVTEEHCMRTELSWTRTSRFSPDDFGNRNESMKNLDAVFF